MTHKHEQGIDFSAPLLDGYLFMCPNVVRALRPRSIPVEVGRLRVVGRVARAIDIWICVGLQCRQVNSVSGLSQTQMWTLTFGSLLIAGEKGAFFVVATLIAPATAICSQVSWSSASSVLSTTEDAALRTISDPRHGAQSYALVFRR